MDPLSVVASVAGIAATGLQLSQTIYALISTFYEAEEEMSTIANDLSLLAMVLNELERVLRRDTRVYRRRMVRVVNEIMKNCESVFQSISTYVSRNPQDTRYSKQFQRRLRWYFQRHRVRPLQAGLESMKSTLNVLLHVVQLARVAEAESFIPKSGTIFTNVDVWNERQVLVGVVLDNRRSILILKQIEEDREQGRNLNKLGEDDSESSIVTTNKIQQKKKKGRFDSVSDTRDRGTIGVPLGNTEATADYEWDIWGLSSRKKKGKKGKEGEKKERKEKINNNRKLRDASPIQSRSASRARDAVEHYEISEPGPSASGSRSSVIAITSNRDQINGSNDLSSTSERQNHSLHQSPSFESFSIAPEFPITTSDESHSFYHYYEEDIQTDSSTPQIKVSGKGLAAETHKSQESLPEVDIVTPTAQWFLSLVPHEPDVTALIVRPSRGQINHLRARAEETAKTLLLEWTNIDPDSIAGDNSEDLSYAQNSNSSKHGPARAAQIANQPYQTPYTSQDYQGYAPQQWYQPPVYTLPPSTAMGYTLSPPPNENQMDSEELARLKKLILDEKAEQDRRAAEMATSAPPTAPFAPIVTGESLKDTMPGEGMNEKRSNSVQMAPEHTTLRKAETPGPQPVIMRDWLGRKFMFPIDVCQTWEGMHNLIQGAFGHELQYRSMVEEGKYLISNATGEYILPSTWEWFVQPGMEINMEILVLDADRDEPICELVTGDGRDKAAPQSPIPPQAPEVPSLEGPRTPPSRSDGEPSVDDVADDETNCSCSDVISYVERSDPRYLSIENVLLEQKQAQIETEMKLERNRRFFQLKQQLVEQGAAIQARQDAADHAEQDSKLAWLEKRVRDQKEMLDRLPPLLMTPPSSSAGDSFGQSVNSPRPKPSFRARLLGRIPTRSTRSKGSITSQQMITEG